MTAEIGFTEESKAMMDLAYWGFRFWPFERTLAPERFFASPQHDEAMSRLLFLVEEKRRCGIITGCSGSGKTFLMKLIGHRAERLGRLVGRCDSTGLDCNELITQVAMVCRAGCDPTSGSARIWNGLRARFTAFAVINQPVVLLIDHFESRIGELQAVRRLIQLADLVGLKLTIVLATAESQISPELLELVELRIDLSPWSLQETDLFISHAIEYAAMKKRLFSTEAVEAIHEICMGIPVKIVSVCNLCLLAAQGMEETLVTLEIVEAVASELFPGSDLSNRRSYATSPQSRRFRERAAH